MALWTTNSLPIARTHTPDVKVAEREHDDLESGFRFRIDYYLCSEFLKPCSDELASGLQPILNCETGLHVVCCAKVALQYSFVSKVIY